MNNQNNLFETNDGDMDSPIRSKPTVPQSIEFTKNGIDSNDPETASSPARAQNNSISNGIPSPLPSPLVSHSLEMESVAESVCTADGVALFDLVKELCDEDNSVADTAKELFAWIHRTNRRDGGTRSSSSLKSSPRPLEFASIPRAIETSILENGGIEKPPAQAQSPGRMKLSQRSPRKRPSKQRQSRQMAHSLPSNSISVDANQILNCSFPLTSNLASPSESFLRSISEYPTDNIIDHDNANRKEEAFLQNAQAQLQSRNFATEHRIFLHAILDVLTERDQFTKSNYYLSTFHCNKHEAALKVGHLRKASRRIKGLWKTKLVEIRMGVFSYCDEKAIKRKSGSGAKASANTSVNTNQNNANGNMSRDFSLRKDLPLHSKSCSCRAVKVRSVKILPGTSGNGAVFELCREGGQRRLWMANTREERQEWMQAIHAAMVGSSSKRGDGCSEFHIEDENAKGDDATKQRGNIPPKSPYKPYLERYLHVRAATTNAQSKDEYLKGLKDLRASSITVPVHWIRSQIDNSPAAAAFMETHFADEVGQLWKDLLRDSVEINGKVLFGESFHGPDRIVGELTQQILSLNKLVYSRQNRGCFAFRDRYNTGISEAQAAAYALDILLACDRTKSGGDSYYCAENLCLNRELVVMCPSSTEANPLSISVCESKVDSASQKHSKIREAGDVFGCVLTRTSSSDPWTRRFVALSTHVLYCYEESHPNGSDTYFQIPVRGAYITEASFLPNKTHHYTEVKLFDNPSMAQYACTISTPDEQSKLELLHENENDFLLWKMALEYSANPTENANNPITNPNNAHETAAAGENNKFVEYATPTVDVEVNVSTEYKMCTLDPQGNESDDTWA
ncbi:hypothetical protein ACHAXS_011752 [Conticribra weissflogii]